MDSFGARASVGTGRDEGEKNGWGVDAGFGFRHDGHGLNYKFSIYAKM